MKVICQDFVDALNRLLDGFTSSMQMKLVNLYCSFVVRLGQTSIRESSKLQENARYKEMNLVISTNPKRRLNVTY